MLWGYIDKTLSDDGLCQMREVSVAAAPQSLRELAGFLERVAAELEEQPLHPNWHRHIPSKLHRELGCDFIICAPTDE
jgi:hypothetical protein